ncbi:MAG: hypothetical protein ACREMQ_09875 [Longimicrobiales bacterium]
MNPIIIVGIIANTILLLGGLVIGGVLLLPIVRRLANHLERTLIERHQAPQLQNQELRRLAEDVQMMRAELARVAERQEFVETLLEKRESIGVLPAPDRG